MTLISLLLTVSAVLCFSAGSLRQYHFVNTSMSWTEAQRYCRQNHKDLTTVNNMNDLQDIINTVNRHTEYVWIGLRKINSHAWRWSLENPRFQSQYLKWKNGQPNNNYNDNEDCVCMFEDGLWHDARCTDVLPFICYNDSNKTFILVENNKTPVKKKWHEAQRYCREYHTDLASVRNDSENKEIMNLIKQNCTNDKKAWIGLFRDSWVWSDHSTSAFRNWHDGQPDNKCCAKVTTQDKTWMDSNCEDKLPFVCHDDGLMLFRENVTWTGALERCRSIHMDLVSVDSEEIQRGVMNVIKNAFSSEVWLGLRHSCVVGLWFWVNGEIMCYENWAEGNGTAEEDCSNGRAGAIQTGRDHSWISLPETHKLNFICSKI